MKFFRRLISLILILIFAFGSGVSAESGNKDYYIIKQYPYKQDIADTYTVDKSISIFGLGLTLSDPKDLCIYKNEVYILDSGNSRIIVTDMQLEFLREIVVDCKLPEGIYVYDDCIYVADTGNGRVVKFSLKGEILNTFSVPKDESYDSEYDFRPFKVGVDSTGKLYILNKMDYHGFIVIDNSGRFTGYIGTTQVKVSIKDKFLRLFATAAQREQIARSTPAYFTGFDITDENIIFGVSNWEKKNQIKKLTPAGANIFPDAFYGEENENINFGFLPGFSDIAVYNGSIIYAADIALNKIYVYDSEGQNLSVFGGMGTKNGSFSGICAIDIDSNGRVFALDNITGVVQIFEPTALMKEIIDATVMYNDGRYEDAESIWELVLNVDTTHYLANIGMAKAQYRAGRYADSMQSYMNANDRKGFSDAFSRARLKFVRNNFILVAISVVAVILLLLYLLKISGGKAKKITKSYSVSAAREPKKFWFSQLLLIIFHPIDAFDRFKKERDNLQVVPIISTSVIIIAVRTVQSLFTHFPFTVQGVGQKDIIQQISVFILPLLLFTVVNFLITSVMGGEQKLKEAASGFVYSLAPYFIFMIPITVLSNVLTVGEAGLYYTLSGGVMLWSIALILLSVYRMNGYTVGKFVGVVLITVFAVACFVLITFLICLVSYQLIRFISELGVEISFITAGR